MTKHAAENGAVPPQWAERLLRLLLSPADRETITGDLLEEYREVARPMHGPIGARRWYVRQAASLILALNSPAQWAIWFAGATALAMAFLLRHRLEPPFPSAAWLALAILGGAALSLRLSHLAYLWRAGVMCGVLLNAVAIMAAAAAARLAPDPWAVFYAVVFFAAGFTAAWRTHRVGTGILTAAATGVIAATLWMTLVTSVSVLFPGLVNQLGPPIAEPLFRSPTMAVVFINSVNDPLMLVMFSIPPGTIGAMSGRALRAVLDRRAIARQLSIEAAL